jgi:hypothetical protein
MIFSFLFRLDLFRSFRVWNYQLRLAWGIDPMNAPLELFMNRDSPFLIAQAAGAAP